MFLTVEVEAKNFVLNLGHLRRRETVVQPTTPKKGRLRIRRIREGHDDQARRDRAIRAPGRCHPQRKPRAPGERSAGTQEPGRDVLEMLAKEWRGEGGVPRLEQRIGKDLNTLTRAEADEWIDRLTPEHQR